MSVGVVNKQTGDRIQTAGDPLDKVGNLANLTTPAKDNAVNAINEVNAGLATKADITDLAPAFSTATAYTVGQYVSYDGNIYKCTSAHSAGAWVAGDFTLVAVGSELSEINSNIFSLAGLLNKCIGIFTTSDTVPGSQNLRYVNLALDTYAYMTIDGIIFARYGVYAINITCGNNGDINSAIIEPLAQQEDVNATISYSGNDVTIDLGYAWASATLVLVQPKRTTDANKISDITVTYSAP